MFVWHVLIILHDFQRRKLDPRKNSNVLDGPTRLETMATFLLNKMMGTSMIHRTKKAAKFMFLTTKSLFHIFLFSLTPLCLI
jgi:hypothetical protein